MDNSARKGGTVQWRTSERIIRANERLIEYLHRAGVRARGGPIHSPEVVRCACRPKCARRVRIGEELGLVGGVTQGVLGLVRVDGRQQVGRSHRRVIFVSVVRLGCWGSVPLRWWPSTA